MLNGIRYSLTVINKIRMAHHRKRPVAVFHFKKHRAMPSFMAKARVVAMQIEKRSDLFPSPSPSIAGFKAHIEELSVAQVKVKTGLRGTASKRDMVYNKVCKDIYSLLWYVQQLADETKNELAAIALITSSGFSLKGVRGKGKAQLKAKQVRGTTSIVLLAAAAGKRAIYHWQKAQTVKSGPTFRPRLARVL